jgi:Immunity protein 26
MRKVVWQVGDLFAVPLSNGTYSLGQAAFHEPRAMDSVLCGFYDLKLAAPGLEGIAYLLTENRLVSLEFVTREALDRGRWPVIGHAPAAHRDAYRGLRVLRDRRFVGTRIVPSSRMVAMLEAWFGLRPWHGGSDPEALERLLYRAGPRATR